MNTYGHEHKRRPQHPRAFLARSQGRTSTFAEPESKTAVAEGPTRTPPGDLPKRELGAENPFVPRGCRKRLVRV